MRARVEVACLSECLVSRACLLAVSQRQNDVQLRIEIARCTGRTARWDSLAFQAQTSASAGIFGYGYFDGAVGRRHGNARAKCRFPRGDRHDDRHIAAVDAEKFVLAQRDFQVQVSSAPLSETRPPLSAQRQ